MLKGGEDPVFIARRLQPQKTLETRIQMRFCLLFPLCSSSGYAWRSNYFGAVYLATSAKSNSTYLAINWNLPRKRQIYQCLYTWENQANETARLWHQLSLSSWEHFVLQDYLPPELKGTKLPREISVRLKANAYSNADGTIVLLSPAIVPIPQ